ncbi:MAG: methylenetetrahydrofolate reductase [NAD(P)H] [Planctomycetota bacterium]|nr:methylenetetrahydrofolate reductase [NAD(P)H] [Planctomycetota bacterium]
MRFIKDIHAERTDEQPILSIEFFPPKTEKGIEVLFQNTVPRLMELKPDFCSVTYGAGGTTRDTTLEIVDRIQREFNLPTMAHLTCVNATREEIVGVLTEAKERGIINILALRGDPPEGEFKKTEGGFEYSYELVNCIREMGGFSIGTAGFPEGHIACEEGKLVDWGHLKTKIECGADFVITQLFFDNKDSFEFRDHLISEGVTVPLCPGVLPILSTEQIKRFTDMCGAKLPQPVLSKLDELGDDDDAVRDFGIEYASNQCRELIDQGVPGIHFYTLNKYTATAAIFQNLGLA